MLRRRDLDQEPHAEVHGCSSRDGSDALGFRKKTKVRAFWLCRTCAHWTEVLVRMRWSRLEDYQSSEKYSAEPLVT